MKHVPVPVSDPKVIFGETPAVLYEQTPVFSKESRDVSFGVPCKDERVRSRVFC